MGAIKFFNFAMPYDVWQELRAFSQKKGKSVAEVVRQGIEIVLRNPSCGGQRKDECR
jgi:hypothetical protein